MVTTENTPASTPNTETAPKIEDTTQKIEQFKVSICQGLSYQSTFLHNIKIAAVDTLAQIQILIPLGIYNSLTAGSWGCSAF